MSQTLCTCMHWPTARVRSKSFLRGPRFALLRLKFGHSSVHLGGVVDALIVILVGRWSKHTHRVALK